ncbi:ABC transporter ATP-binding protein [Actinacidiphila yeochonensis]|uniref:ABC transporter ATP-binding protein n=1 Tax=Actinacidiphila yeochonensis TaxID=89050 RepID=UPI00068D93C2|nr:ABC transporter ATP-binding protein [Actinacidiphila yeochonensis]
MTSTKGAGRAGSGTGAGGKGALLRLRKVSRSYGKRQALHPIDLDVPAGRCVALFGHNGSGKSTLLRIASGRDTPTNGQALFAGRAVAEDDPEVRARVAVVGDTVACYPDLTVREHLELVTIAHAVDDAAGWIDQILEDRRLSDHADALPSSLSSGQMQSLLLAAALVRPRDLLVLDEPEQRLDPEARQRLAELLVAEKKSGVAVLLATHQAELAEAVADHMVALEDGRVIAKGTPAAVLRELGVTA